MRLWAWLYGLLGFVTETPKAGGGAGDEPALPITLPPIPATLPTSTVVTPLQLSRFGPAAIDYQINAHLQDTIPDAAGALLDLKIKSADGDKVLSGVMAIKGKGGWGAALGGAIDLNDKRDYEVELIAVKSF